MKARREVARCAGQSSAEYLVGCLFVVALLAVDAGAEKSVMRALIDAVRAGFERFSAAISVP